MLYEVLVPLRGELGHGEGCSVRRGKPAFRRARDGAAEPVLGGANSDHAEFASVVVDAKGRQRGFSGLRPLAPTDGRGKVASALAGPEGQALPLRRGPSPTMHGTRKDLWALAWSLPLSGSARRRSDKMALASFNLILLTASVAAEATTMGQTPGRVTGPRR